jgi:hypothetical protein
MPAGRLSAAVLPAEAQDSVRHRRHPPHVAPAQCRLTGRRLLTADWAIMAHRRLESDVIAEAHLDQDSIVAGIRRFAEERPQRSVVSGRCWGCTLGSGRRQSQCEESARSASLGSSGASCRLKPSAKPARVLRATQ